jgi:hypothetical protein
VDVQASVLQRHHRSCIGKLGVACHAVRPQFGLDVIQGVEAFHFTCDPAFEMAGVETGYGPDTAPAGQERAPERLQPDPIGGENTHPCDDDAVTL